MKSAPVIAFFGTLLCLLLLTACQGGRGAEVTIEAYIQALVRKDGNALIALSCNAWEEGARTDARAYDGVETRLEGLNCRDIGTTGAREAVIACTGTLIGNYNGEDRQIDLSAREFLAVEEGGEWRMCGYR